MAGIFEVKASKESFHRMPNKCSHNRPAGWTAKSVASPQRGPLQRRYMSKKNNI
jgi:hypothetical protein